MLGGHQQTGCTASLRVATWPASSVHPHPQVNSELQSAVERSLKTEKEKVLNGRLCYWLLPFVWTLCRFSRGLCQIVKPCSRARWCIHRFWRRTTKICPMNLPQMIFLFSLKLLVNVVAFWFFSFFVGVKGLDSILIGLLGIISGSVRKSLHEWADMQVIILWAQRAPCRGRMLRCTQTHRR